MTGPGGYGLLDRLTHRIAFSSRRLQRALMQMDADAGAGKAAGDVGPPVFIAGLPRSGSTLLLELLYGTGLFASHTYRHMPFVTAPRLWARISASQRRRATQRDRPHGDGMSVGEDSPEAFEEVIWKAWLPFLHRIDRIETVDALAVPGFAEVFRAHVRSLCTLESARGGRQLRYLSKNNANIGRLRVLHELFPDARVIVPFRHPAHQAASLMRQHERFVAIHAGDPFSLRYMGDLGHHEFGADFRPIDFDGWMGPARRRPDPAMWMEYWAAAYHYALRVAEPGVVFFDHDAARADPDRSMRLLAAAGAVPDGSLAAASHLIRPAETDLDLELPPATQAVWDELRRRAAQAATSP